MNSLRNKVQLIGNLGADPEFKKLDNDKCFAKFSVATNESIKDKNGNYKTDTQWHNITVWGKQAELAEKMLQKGSEIALEGKLVNRNYTDKEGNKRYTTEIQVSELVILSKKAISNE